MATRIIAVVLLAATVAVVAYQAGSRQAHIAEAVEHERIADSLAGLAADARAEAERLRGIAEQRSQEVERNRERIRSADARIGRLLDDMERVRGSTPPQVMEPVQPLLDAQDSVIAEQAEAIAVRDEQIQTLAVQVSDWQAAAWQWEDTANKDRARADELQQALDAALKAAGSGGGWLPEAKWWMVPAAFGIGWAVGEFTPGR